MARASSASATASEPAGPGHNIGAFSPIEHKALKLDHFRRIAAQKAKVDAEQAEYKRLRKEAKVDGIILSDIDFMQKCAQVEDASIIPDRLRRETEIASWFALPVEFQPDMFGDFGREPGEDRARREGRAAGASGFGANPYDENSPSGRAWAAAWSEEQALLRDALQAAMEKKNASGMLIKGAAADDGSDLDDERGEGEGA